MVCSNWEMPPNSWVAAPTYWVTAPTSKAPAQDLRQTKRYTTPVSTAERAWANARRRPTSPMARRAMAPPRLKALFCM